MFDSDLDVAQMMVGPGLDLEGMLGKGRALGVWIQGSGLSVLGSQGSLFQSQYHNCFYNIKQYLN